MSPTLRPPLPVPVALLLLGLALACGGKDDSGQPPDVPEGTWQDSACGLLWQQELGTTAHWVEAADYCDTLDLGDLAWRLPGIGELRCLVNGCQDTATDGDCEVTDECTGVGCYIAACEGCGDASGDIGCYWSNQLGTTCDDPLWSASAQGDEAAWVLHFQDASISHDIITEAHYVRCVSNG